MLGIWPESLVRGDVFHQWDRRKHRGRQELREPRGEEIKDGRYRLGTGSVPAVGTDGGSA